MDNQVRHLIAKEFKRQRHSICLIASENITTAEVVRAQSSCFMNKYAEGMPGKRFYEGCEVADELEALCQSRACELFGTKYANVQPHSGAQANMAVLNALLEPGDTILGMDLQSGGHLSHGFKLNFSGKYYKSVQYTVSKKDHLINYGDIYELAIKHGPKIIIGGGSSYTRSIDWQKLRLIADEVGAVLLADIAHLAGLIAGKAISSPVGIADVITSTTHKTLRGPRGGLVLTNDQAIYNKVNRSIMPGIQGGPLMHTIAAKAICFGECLDQSFARYAQQVVKNAKVLEKVFLNYKIPMVSGGTDNHMIVLDVSRLGLTGRQAASMLAEHRIICNKNGIPFDTQSLVETSGLRIGTPTITTCGFDERDTVKLAESILLILHRKAPHDMSDLFRKVKMTMEQNFGADEII